jgi:hypothetical protein
MTAGAGHTLRHTYKDGAELTNLDKTVACMRALRL